MVPKKREWEGPGSEKSWSSIVGEYQDKEMGGGDWEMGRGKRAYETEGEAGTRKGESIRNVNKE